MKKVVDWTVHQRLENVHQNNEPTGLMKQRKVCVCVCVYAAYTLSAKRFADT